MAGRRTNLALLVLTTLAVATGVLGYGLGTGWNRWSTVAHGAIGVAMVALSPWKSAVSRRGLRRPRAGRGASLGLAALVVVALVTGFAHRFGWTDLGPVSTLQIHVAMAVAAMPLVGWHVAARPVRPRVTDLSRRSALRGGALAGGAVATTVLLPAAAGRRFSGSLEDGSGDPDKMPVTQWFTDGVPDVETRGWQLRVGNRSFDLSDLDRRPLDHVDATIDCTGGWHACQRWSGVRLDRLLPDPVPEGTQSVIVRSVTGYRRRFPIADAPHLLVATRAGGEPLSAGHGAPARLVAPGRRGFWWVKWVTTIDLSDRPWWWQAPFPLQ